MATIVPIHAAGDGAWSWHLVGDALHELGHDMVAVDLPDDPDAGLWDYADAVVAALGQRSDLIVVAHSFGGFTGPLVCERVPVEQLVLVTAMVPAPGEPPADWWANTGYEAAAEPVDDMETYYHDVPSDLAAEAARRGRSHPSERAYEEPWHLKAWPDVPTRFLLCRDDRFFDANFMRRVVRERLGIQPEEIDGGHCPNLSRPMELAAALIEPLDSHARRVRDPGAR